VELLCANRATNSKKELEICGFSNWINNNEKIEKLLDSDDSEFSDTDESSNSDIGEQ
jgi:hypothetical protein